MSDQVEGELGDQGPKEVAKCRLIPLGPQFNSSASPLTVRKWDFYRCFRHAIRGSAAGLPDGEGNRWQLGARQVDRAIIST
jgi:hypothetical protein